MDVLKRINRLRLEKGWSVYRLSIEANIPQSTLTNMINRETQPSIATLELICGALGMTMAEFFTENHENEPRAVNEEEFMKAFRALSDNSKRIIFDLMNELNEKH